MAGSAAPSARSGGDQSARAAAADDAPLTVRAPPLLSRLSLKIIIESLMLKAAVLEREMKWAKAAEVLIDAAKFYREEDGRLANLDPLEASELELGTTFWLDVRIRLARAYMGQAEYDEARAEIDVGIKEAKAIKEIIMWRRLCALRAELSIHEGDMDSAFQIYADIIETSKENNLIDNDYATILILTADLKKEIERNATANVHEADLVVSTLDEGVEEKDESSSTAGSPKANKGQGAFNSLVPEDAVLLYTTAEEILAKELKFEGWRGEDADPYHVSLDGKDRIGLDRIGLDRLASDRIGSAYLLPPPPHPTPPHPTPPHPRPSIQPNRCCPTSTSHRWSTWQRFDAGWRQNVYPWDTWSVDQRVPLPQGSLLCLRCSTLLTRCHL